MPTSAPEPGTEEEREDLQRRLLDLERQNRLLLGSVDQLARVRRLWSNAIAELKAAKADLQASRSFLDRMLETAPLPILAVDTVNGRILFANAATERLTGIEAAKLNGRRALRLLHGIGRRAARRLIHDLEAQGGPHEIRVSAPGHGTRLLELYSGWVGDGAGGGDQLILIVQDVTDKRLAEEKLRLAGKIIDTSLQAVVVLNAAGTITDLNPACQQITGYAAKTLKGTPLTTLLAHGEGQEASSQFWPALQRQGVWEGEVTLRRRDAAPFPASLAATSLKMDEHEPTQYILLFNDITERKQVEARLRFLSYHDSLTGLPNRLLFRDRLRSALSTAQCDQEPAALLVLDLDGFKEINDSLGHNAGDELLKSVAHRLESAVRRSDTVARLGGDEFAVILPGMGRAEDIETVMRKLLDLAARPYVLAGTPRSVSASIGASLYPYDTADMDELMTFADVAMYRAKEQGRNTFAFYRADMNVRVLARLNLMNRLEQALSAEEFVLHYQAQMDLRTHRVAGVEALVRWQHPDLGLLLPPQFVPLAEESGLIVDLGRWIVRCACGQIDRWRRAGWPAPRVAINVSARQFVHEELCRGLADVQNEFRLPPGVLEVELTEANLPRNLDAPKAGLAELEKRGLGVVLDDFGSGYSSLTLLQRLPFTRIKIAQPLVRGMSRDARSAALVRAIVDMAHALEMRVAAKGVEDEAQLDLLRACGCDEAQGSLLARPMPVAELEDWLARGYAGVGVQTRP